MNTTNASRFAGFTLLCISCLTIMVGCIIVPGLPAIASALGASRASGLLVTMPALGVVIFGPLAGRSINRFGLYWSVLTALIGYGFLGAAAAFLTNPWILFLDRLLLGATTAVIMSGGTGLISALYSGKLRLQMIAWQGMAIELGGVLFLFLGGLLASQGWRWPFLLYLVAWLFAIPFALLIPREEHITRETSKGPAPSRALVLVFAAAAVSMLLFFTAVILIPKSLQATGLNEAQTGYFLSFVSLVAVAFAALMPRAVELIGESRTLILAFLFYAVAQLVFAFSQTLVPQLFAALFLGAGFGVSIPLVNHMTVDQSSEKSRATNLSYLSMAIFAGQFASSGTELVTTNTQTTFISAVVFALLAAGFLKVNHSKTRTRS